MPYPKMKNMLGLQSAPAVPQQKPLMTPQAPVVPKVPISAPMKPAFGNPAAMPTAKPARMTVPSLQATANEASPIEIGDPKRLQKIATILRMGRK